MSGINKVIIVGRLGADPEMRNTQGGHNVCSLSLATSEVWVKDGKREEKTEWHRVVVWGRLAEIASKYLKKGRLVYVEGRLQTRSWQDPQGQKRYSTEIVASNLQFLEGSQGAGSGRGEYGAESAPMPEDPYAGGGDFYGSPYENTGRGNDSFSSNSRPVDDDIPF